MERNYKYKPIDKVPPPEGELVITMICDGSGSRNHQQLKKQGNLWFCEDGTYVYFTPTHWCPIYKMSQQQLCDWDKHYFNWT